MKINFEDGIIISFFLNIAPILISSGKFEFLSSLLINSDESISETEDEASLSTETSKTREEEDDLEIPAFLRRQKN